MLLRQQQDLTRVGTLLVIHISPKIQTQKVKQWGFCIWISAWRLTLLMEQVEAGLQVASLLTMRIPRVAQSLSRVYITISITGISSYSSMDGIVQGQLQTAAISIPLKTR